MRRRLPFAARTAARFIPILAILWPLHAAGQIPVGSRVGTETAAASTSGYDDGGRRDPFVTLVTPKRATAGPQSGKPVFGLAALAVEDALVTGIVKAGPAFIAILRSPDGKSFMARNQDHLQNGVVKTIDADGVLFVQQAADAMGVVRPREVRKALHATGAGQ
jgi:hypothetical protein